MFKTIFTSIVTVCLSINFSFAQDSKVFFTTSVGVNKIRKSLNDVLKPSIAFSSGIEIINRNKGYAQITADFNTLRYNQQVKDGHSPYLFQNTNSSLFVLGLNGGRNLYFKNNQWFASAYAGGGYLNIGEPRAILMGNIVRQEVIRKGSGFARIGARMLCNTKIKFLQTLYLDGSWWVSPAKVQNEKLSGYTFQIGTRMGM